VFITGFFSLRKKTCRECDEKRHGKTPRKKKNILYPNQKKKNILYPNQKKKNISFRGSFTGPPPGYPMVGPLETKIIYNVNSYTVLAVTLLGVGCILVN
jgi:hypothetical protein